MQPEDPVDALPSKEVAVEEDEEDGKYLSGVALWVVLVPVTIGYFLMFLDTCVVATASPAITVRFNSLIDIGWYGGAYQLGNSAVQPLTGKIYSHFNTKAGALQDCLWTYLVFFLIFELGSAIAGAAVSSPMFIVGRAIAGAGASGIGTGALTIISCVLPVRKQAKALGMNMGIGQMGIALGPIIGGVFTEYVSWRWCFYINLPLGGAFAVLLLFSRIPEATTKLPPRQVLGTAIRSLDLPGFMLISPAAIMVLLGLQYGGTLYAWDSSVVIGLIVGGGVTFILFLIWEYYQGDAAMIPMAMLKKKVIWSAAATLFFLLGAILAAEYYLAMYFQTIHNNTPTMSGVHILPTTISLLSFTVVSGVMTEKLGYYLPWNLGGAAIAAVGYGLMSMLKPSTPPSKWIGYQIIYGIGSGSMVSVPYMAIQNLVPAPQIPLAMTIALFSQAMGAATWLVAANAVFNNGLRQQLQQRFAEIGVDPDFIVSAGANSIRDIVQGDGLAAALECYTEAISHVMYLGVGLSAVTFLFGTGLGWKDIRKTKKLQEIKSSPSPSPSLSSAPVTEDESGKHSDAANPGTV
ncbi:putative MFS transporter [Aspergillus floccosus]